MQAKEEKLSTTWFGFINGEVQRVRIEK